MIPPNPTHLLGGESEVAEVRGEAAQASQGLGIVETRHLDSCNEYKGCPAVMERRYER